MFLKRIVLSVLFVLIVLGCAAPGVKKTPKRVKPPAMTADEFLHAVVKETKGKCNLANLAYTCEVKMTPTRSHGVYQVAVFAMQEEAEDGSFVASALFEWDANKGSVIQLP